MKEMNRLTTIDGPAPCRSNQLLGADANGAETSSLPVPGRDKIKKWLRWLLAMVLVLQG